ncbi:MAG: glycosyltransferase family 2 protein [Cyclobacteriaceae bacterium]|nr:glycosyltransferase family 2 protein [Cyclobacteriaceae bacterium]
MDLPLVSVICLCYNHARFIKESLESVLAQDYSPVEIIVVDDKSSDMSRQIIEEIALGNPEIRTIFLENNQGNCKAFNTGFRASSGKYIIDLAADDILMPERIRTGVACMERSDESFGVHFTDAAYIDENAVFLRTHYKKDHAGNLIEHVPEGDIYRELLARYFICSPTMMIKRIVLEVLGGYDENLAYEDFDFWVRSSRKYKYCFTDEVLVKKRLVRGSLSSRQYTASSRILASTYRVCIKAERLNRNRSEHLALAKRAAYEGRQAILSGNFVQAMNFMSLIDRLPIT